MKSAHQHFETLRARARVGIALEAIAWIAIAVVAYVFISYAADRTFRLELGYRVFLLIAAVGAIAFIIFRRWLQPRRFQITDDELALAVERHDPELAQSLISSVQFQRDLEGSNPSTAGGGESTTLMNRVVGDVESRLASIPFHGALNRKRFVRFGAILGGCVLALTVWVAASPDAALWARRNLGLSDTPWPRDTMLAFVDITPGEPLRVPERDDVTLRVQARGVVPETLTLTATFAGGDSVERPMEQIGDDMFSITLDTLLEDLTAIAEGGDGITESVSIQLVPRPKIEDVSVEIRYPTYFGRDPEPVEELTGDLRVPRGSTLAVHARSDKALRSAELLFGEGEIARSPAVLAADGVSFDATITPEESGMLTFDVLDTDRLGPVQAPQLFVRLIDDTAPRIDFRPEGIGSLITAQARIPGFVEFRDDHGMQSVSASFQLSDAVAAATAADGGESATATAPFEPAPIQELAAFVVGSISFDTPTLLDLTTLEPSTQQAGAEARVRPGQLLALEFAALDHFEPTAQEGKSERVHFRVVTREKLLEELQRRQAEQRAELERILERERAMREEFAELVSPTSTEPAAAQSKSKALTLARRQRTLGRRVQAVGDRYRQILREFENNRLFEQAVTRSKDAKIASPLLTLAAEDFPRTAGATSTWSETGGDAPKASIVDGYDRIIAAIQRVLDQMEQTEDIAAVLEALRIVIKTESQAEDLVEKLRDESLGGLFDPDGDKNSSKEKNK